jgi:phosphatidate cytidylyltransferase
MSDPILSAGLPPILQKIIADASAPVIWGLVGVMVLLMVGTAFALILPMAKPGRDWSNLRQRVWSWWIMIVLLASALIAGWQTMTILFGGISFLALKEFLSLAPTRREDRLVILFAYLTVPVAYALVFFDMYEVYLVTIPVWFFLLTPFLMTIGGQTRGFLATVAAFSFGAITCVYNLGLIPFLARVPSTDAPQAGGAGLVFFLLFATEANDVLQYVWGKLLGRNKIMPKVSPSKTWEGFLGGWICTAILIYALAPVFTPLKPLPAALLAVLLPLAGFAGDVTMSAIKRDLGVKDTSGFIPGHGGVLDRLDSLAFTAPLYFHILAYYALATY